MRTQEEMADLLWSMYKFKGQAGLEDYYTRLHSSLLETDPPGVEILEERLQRAYSDITTRIIMGRA
jgi:hypothetical protein